jgi:hypothetical protein
VDGFYRDELCAHGVQQCEACVPIGNDDVVLVCQYVVSARNRSLPHKEPAGKMAREEATDRLLTFDPGDTFVLKASEDHTFSKYGRGLRLKLREDPPRRRLIDFDLHRQSSEFNFPTGCLSVKLLYPAAAHASDQHLRSAEMQPLMMIVAARCDTPTHTNISGAMNEKPLTVRN